MNKLVLKEIDVKLRAHKPILTINHYDPNIADEYFASHNKEVVEYLPSKVIRNNKTKEILYRNIDLLDYLHSVLLVDEMEKIIILKDVSGQLSNEEVSAHIKMIAEKTMAVDSCNYNVRCVIVSSICNLPNDIMKYSSSLEIAKPSIQDIKEIIEDFCNENNLHTETISKYTHNFAGLDEIDIKQILSVLTAEQGTITKDEIVAEKEKIISQKGYLQIIKDKGSIDDIGGLEGFKLWIKDKSAIYKDIERAREACVSVPKGVFVVGITGCGKSLVAKAASYSFEAPLIRLDMAGLLGKYLGESEANLHEALKIAEASSPCILWIDEIDKAFAGVGTDDSGNSATTRMFGNFLTWMQEKRAPVFVVATANDISKLPPELMRKGRFDEVFFVDLPCENERRQIFRVHLKKKKVNRVDELISFDLLKFTDGCNGADIEAIVNQAIEYEFLKKAVLSKSLLEKIAKEHISIFMQSSEKIKIIRDKSNEMRWLNASTVSSVSANRSEIKVVIKPLVAGKYKTGFSVFKDRYFNLPGTTLQGKYIISSKISIICYLVYIGKGRFITYRINKNLGDGNYEVMIIVVDSQVVFNEYEDLKVLEFQQRHQRRTEDIVSKAEDMLGSKEEIRNINLLESLTKCWLERCVMNQVTT